MPANSTVAIRNKMIRLESGYTHACDIIPNMPVVTYADHELLTMIHELVGLVEDLQERVAGLEQRTDRDNFNRNGV